MTDNKNSIDEQLRQFEDMTERNWQRIIYQLRRHMDIWAQKSVKPSWGQMKLSYWPVICNISVDGSTASEIGRKAMVIKQTMSRTLKELEEKGMIVSKTNEKDKRSECLELTNDGKQLILDASVDMAKMMATYKALVGEEDMETTINVLNKIIAYHETLNLEDDQQ